MDPRLLRLSRGVRGVLAMSVVVAGLTAILVVVQAFCLADAITGAFQQGAGLTQLRTPLLILAAVVIARAVLAGVSETVAQRAASRTSGELRAALLAQVVRLGPVWLTGQRRAEIATLATRGVDAIEPYVARYLPQLAIAAVVPLVVGIAILTQDLLAAIIVAITAPLIPLFMALIGMYTQRSTERQWRTLAHLSGHFLDVVAGLPTLKAFGRAKVQAKQLAQVDGEYRQATMGVLRISFLSSLVLELLATLSVAVVAVSIGLRLVSGDLSLRTALIVLVLCPEVYLPIRMVGQQFHAAADGVSTAQLVFAVLATPVPETGSRQDLLTGNLPADPLIIADVSVTYPGALEPALSPTSLTLRPGTLTALAGPSGAGKTTLLSAILGFIAPTTGAVRVGEVDLVEVAPEAWLRQIAYVGQDPILLGPTVAADVRLGRPTATDEEVVAALRSVGLDDTTLRHGINTSVGDLASDLSAGQRRRVALARAVLRQAPYVLLDEPTAALDSQTEADIVAMVRRLADGGAAVLVVAHRPALLAAADQIITLAPANVVSSP